MAGYGDATEIKRQLRLADADPDDAAAIVRVAELNENLSRIFDSKCNRYGTASETRTVDAGTGYGWSDFTPLPANGWYWPGQTAAPYPLALVLPWPALTVTAIKEGGTWSGAVWTDETALVAADYRLTGGDAVQGYRLIERLTGVGWAGPVRITGTWLNAAWTTPPAVVVEALTFLVVHHYREDLMSPAGMVGPEGMQVPSRNPWNYERVRQAVREHGVYRLIV